LACKIEIYFTEWTQEVIYHEWKYDSWCSQVKYIFISYTLSSFMSCWPIFFSSNVMRGFLHDVIRSSHLTMFILKKWFCNILMNFVSFYMQKVCVSRNQSQLHKTTIFPFTLSICFLFPFKYNLAFVKTIFHNFTVKNYQHIN
jgi:hypothetical protein